MIKVSRLRAQDKALVLNAELIETIEETPDTVITLHTGKKLIVEESMDEVLRRVIEYKRAIFSKML
ncbi:MAG TPA: flagellar FlbD family protein [Patescibacteria group bacterium]|nr:flagellar FlbD family protein [Patescibacteria group bacterium]